MVDDLHSLPPAFLVTPEWPASISEGMSVFSPAAGAAMRGNPSCRRMLSPFDESTRRSPRPRAVRLGFASFYALEMGRHAEESARIAGIGGALGLTVHSFIDGVIIGEGFRAGGETGFVLAVAVMLHRLADGASAVGVMLGTEHGIRQTAFMLLATALAPVAGALVPSFLPLPALFLSLLLSFFSGMLLFLGAKHLLPEARRAAASSVTVPASFAAGLVVVYAAYLLSH
jgi:hypothetical protein